MKQTLSFAMISALLIGACGCHRNIQNNEAVRQGILTYLAKRTDLSNMDVAVTHVTFRNDEADATVHFQAKGSSAPGSGMEMNYVLERKGDEWTVKGRSGANRHGLPPDMANPHGVAGSTLPPGHPPLPANPSNGSPQ